MVRMFIRVKSTPNSPRRSVQIVQSLRQGSQVRQKIIRHVGIAMDDQELERLKELAEFIKVGIQTQTQASLFSQEELARQLSEARQQAQTHPMKVDLRALRETQRAVSGIHEVYGKIYRELGLHRLLRVSRYRASSEALFQCVMARIANPKSKRASVRLLEEDFGVRLPLEKVYRMMDQLDASRVERLQRLSGAAAESLLAEPLDLLFFDCTTLYFESFVADELKQPGYSKDAKFKESQVLLALVVTPRGLPVSYEVLPGSSFEGHSLLPVIERMRRRHTLRRVVIVADRGMLSEENLKALESVEAHYIVGARLRKLPKSVQAQLLDSSRYRASAQGEGRLMELYHRGRRVVVRYSSVRARKDARDRQVAVEKLIKKIGKSQNPKSLLNNYGYKKYLHIELTKTRPRKSNDNALVESKNASVVRKHMGHQHIPGRFVQPVNDFLVNVLTPYLNFHRPCLFSEERIDHKGKCTRHYPYRLLMTPYDRLRSLPDAPQYLKPGVTFEQLDDIAMQHSDNEAARMLNEARDKLFQCFNKTRNHAA